MFVLRDWLMTQSYKEQQGASTRLFRRVEPILKQWLPGNFHAVEGHEIGVLRKLDRRAGLDWLHEDEDGRLYGLAFRGQFVKYPFYTFSIRKCRETGAETEFSKLVETVEGSLRPYWTVQGYFCMKTREALALALVKTAHLTQLLTDGLYEERRTGHDEIGQAAFAVVDWERFIEREYPIYYWTNRKRIRRRFDHE